MPLNVSVTPGKVFSPEEPIDLAGLNQLGQPTVVVEGDLAEADLSDPEDGDVIYYDSAKAQWVAGANSMVGAVGSTPGRGGQVPAPGAYADQLYLRGDGTWSSPVSDVNLFNNQTFI